MAFGRRGGSVRKRCHACGNVVERFRSDTKRYTVCNQKCSAELARRGTYAKHRQYATRVHDRKKECTLCLETLSISEFGKTRNGRGRYIYRSRCRYCCAETCWAWRRGISLSAVDGGVSVAYGL